MLNSILLRLKGRFSKDGKYYAVVNEIFGLYPNNIELYKLALIHRSASLFLEDGTQINNERLEFLGDAILESIVSDYLFIEYPDKNEGFLSKVRAKIVSRSTLNEIAVALGLDKHIVVQYSHNHIQKHLYGDALEAMVGAIYLDKGYDFVNRLVINDILKKNVDLRKIVEEEKDFKSRLIEWSQKHKYDLNFETLPAENEEHQPVFVCSVKLGGKVISGGTAASKKEAEQMASRSAFEFIRADEGISPDCAENLSE